LDPQRRRRIDGGAHLFHPAEPHHLQIVDRGQLPGRVRPARVDPLVGEPDVIIEQFGQAGARHQCRRTPPGPRHSCATISLKVAFRSARFWFSANRLSQVNGTFFMSHAVHHPRGYTDSG